jgi:hypothetical protein
MPEAPRPEFSKDCRLHMRVDRRGAMLYCNGETLKALAARLLYIADSPPQEHFEVHIRAEFDHMAGHKADLVIVENTIRSYFERLDDEILKVDPTAKPLGFDVTFMQVSGEDLDKSSNARREEIFSERDIQRYR